MHFSCHKHDITEFYTIFEILLMYFTRDEKYGDLHLELVTLCKQFRIGIEQDK